MLHLLHTDQKGNTQDVIGLVPTITWSGDYQQCARSLDYSLVQEQMAPAVPCEIGTKVLLMEGDEPLFEGHIFSRDRDTGNSQISVHCFDWGFYLRRNKASYKFTGQSPEQIAKRVCGDFGIPVGTLAPTGFSVSRNFFGSSLYEIIQTAYTLAGRQSGKKYCIRFVGRQLWVLEKAVGPDTLVISSGNNLIGAQIRESVEGMVNRVEIYDKDGKYKTTVQDAQSQGLYGVMQEVIKQAGQESALDKAKALLKENGYSQKITVDALGNRANLTGGTVVVQEPTTGIYGLFYIDDDSHTWKNGQYFNQLTLNFESIMDEKEVGELPNQTGSKTKSRGSGGEVF